MLTSNATAPQRDERPATPACPDCGEPIELHRTGWWSHIGLPNGCWRVSIDGPYDPEDN